MKDCGCSLFGDCVAFVRGCLVGDGGDGNVNVNMFHFERIEEILALWFSFHKINFFSKFRFMQTQTHILFVSYEYPSVHLILVLKV